MFLEKKNQRRNIRTLFLFVVVIELFLLIPFISGDRTEIIPGFYTKDTISPEDKALLIECVKEAGAYQRAWTQKAQAEILEEFKNSGDKNVTYPDDRAKWAAAVAPVYEKYYKLFPNWKALVEEIQAIK